MDSRQRGEWGENIALEYLKKNDYVTVATGFRSRYGEIDIIAKSKEYLIFVEVKTRKNAKFAHAREYVGKEKQRKILATANYWLVKHPTKLQPRFDVVEVYVQGDENNHSPQINHIENAFGS